MSDNDLIALVAKAILETDPTCDYEACKQRVESRSLMLGSMLDDLSLRSDIDKNWWNDLHHKAERAIATVRGFDGKQEEDIE